LRSILSYADDNGPPQPGGDAVNDVSFTLPLTQGNHTLQNFVDTILHPTADANDGVFANSPMCWYHYTGYQQNGNRECRFWVQAAARAFFRANLIASDPTATFRQIDDQFGYLNQPIPRGQFFDHRPGTHPTDPGALQPSDKGTEEQTALAAGFPTWI
jgi:hypothetical protein